MSKTIKKLILGPPGTGKTTALIKIVEECIAKGIPPNEIAFLSFTKAAAEEAINRACIKFNLRANDFPFFKTIHSLAYGLIGLRSNEVMEDSHWGEFGRKWGYEITTPSLEFPNMGKNEGDKLMKIYQLARAKQIDCLSEAKNQKSDLASWRLVSFLSRLEQYKIDLGLYDYPDFLDGVHNPLPVQVLIVDEAQDLTKQQWTLVNKLAANVSEFYVAGDDDQAIFEWAGADVQGFLSLGFDRVVLPKSWRLNEPNRGVANRITSAIANRYPKSWTSNGEDGGVHAVNPDFLGGALTKGSWLLLARTNSLLAGLETWAKTCGRVYSVNGKWSNDNPTAKAIVNYSRLSQGHSITHAAYQSLCQYLPLRVQPGFTGEHVAASDIAGFSRAPWYDVFTTSQAQIVYYRNLLKAGESLTKPGNVRVATIHTTKGMEAENVALMCKPPNKMMDDGERRVWYVGATRARRNLYLIDPESNPLFRTGAAYTPKRTGLKEFLGGLRPDVE